MLLRYLSVENFRMIERAEFHFNRTTVVIGENDSGRSSVLEALALALGWGAADDGFAFSAEHFPLGRHPSLPGLPIRLRLEFAPESADEWAQPDCAPLKECLPTIRPADTLSLEIAVQVKREGVAATRWQCRTSGAHASVSDSIEILRWLRRQMPVVRVGTGVIGAGGRSNEGASNASSSNAPPRGPLEIVRKHFEALAAGRPADAPRQLELGYEAARELLAQNPKLLHGADSPLRAVLQEIAGHAGSKPNVKRRSTPPFPLYGTAAQKIGVFLLVGALASVGRGKAAGSRYPLLIIEDPEAHLHPMTLATVWTLLERISCQKIVATHSESLLAGAPLASVRRFTRHKGQIQEWRVPEGLLSPDELRRYTYHVRSRRGAASFARAWLLVEGETEFWIMPQLARICGYDFDAEGVACVEFAQCGLAPLIKVADALGISWHLLADGDRAGQTYGDTAKGYLERRRPQRHLTVLEDNDIEHCFWRYGYADVIRKLAFPGGGKGQNAPARTTIQKAIERTSKPFLAVRLLEAAAERGPDAVPPPLRKLVVMSVMLARESQPKSE